jgi:TolB protein
MDSYLVWSKHYALLLLLLLIGWSSTARAILTIEITQGADAGIPIAVVPFGWAGLTPPPQAVSDIVEADLARSGRFTILPRNDFVSRPTERNDVVFKDWRVLKAEALVIGRVVPAAQGQFQVQYQLFDIYRQSVLLEGSYIARADTLRSAAHQIADAIYEKLIGEPGAFNTRIAYVTRQNTGPKTAVYRLQLADSDGYAPVSIVTSSEPLLSPAWAPDGQRMAYTSFEQDRRSKVYIQHVYKKQRELVADSKGINSAPAWSPDGRRLAVSLSRDGNSEIYLIELATKQLRRLTNDPAIDTEPSWSPDGRQLVFTSDRSGRPQIYRMNADGGPVERLTFEGDYNARPSYSADGKTLAFITGVRGRFHVATLRLDNRALQILTDTRLDESPSFAPNGRMILYATELRGRGVLASVSADGRVRQLYRLDEGDVREPAWSPYNR